MGHHIIWIKVKDEKTHNDSNIVSLYYKDPQRVTKHEPWSMNEYNSTLKNNDIPSHFF